MNPIAVIRKHVFGLPQAEFAACIGRSQPTVSRWESGELKPDISDLASIRELARTQRLDWRDSWFFGEKMPPANDQPKKRAGAA